MKNAKKLIAVLLCVSLLVPVAGLVGVLAADSCVCGETPTIYVNGMNTKDIQKNLGTENQKVIFPPSSDDILAAVEKAVLPMGIGALTGGWDGVADALLPFAGGIIKEFACNPDGSIPDGQGIDWTYPDITDNHSATYDFFYDWREDPVDVAKDLADFVEYVKAGSGHEKFNFIGFSMGSIILDSYLYSLDGDYSSINSVVYEVPALNGITCASQPFTRQVQVDKTALVRFLDENVFSDDGVTGIVSILLSVFKEAGLLDSVEGFANTAISELSDRIYSDVLSDAFASMPGMWSMISDDYYEAAKTSLFAGKEVSETLIDRIDYYHYNIQNTNDERANALYNNPDINFGVIAKYGYTVTPVVENANVMTDGVVDTASASFGATCADMEKTLGEGYTQAVYCEGKNHVSADNVIDASTGTFPDATWYVKFCKHSDCIDYTDALETMIATAPAQPSVFDSAEFPQFMLYDDKAETVSPLTAQNAGTGEPSSIFEPVLGLNSWTVILSRLISWIFSLFKSLEL